MDKFCVDIPKGTEQRILNSVAEQHRFDRFADEGETRLDFGRRMIQNYLKNMVMTAESALAEKAASDSVKNNPNDPLTTLGKGKDKAK